MAHLSIKATPDEHRLVLPGDRLIPAPVGVITNAISIRRPPAEVWPWLIQMGGGRAGWYSYDFLDNGRQPSAERVQPALQHLDVGAIMPALPGRTDGFTVLRIDPGRSLVVGWRPPDGGYLMTWAFVLEPAGTNGTRLIVRARGGPGYRFHGLPSWVGLPLVRAIHFIMERKQLRGIARRVEQES